MSEIGGGVWAVASRLLTNVAVLMAIVAVMGVLAVVSGLMDLFSRWVPGDRIAPAVVMAVTAV